MQAYLAAANQYYQVISRAELEKHAREQVLLGYLLPTWLLNCA